MAAGKPVRNTPLWRQAIHSALDADRFDLEDWAAALHDDSHTDERMTTTPLTNSAAIPCRTRS